MYSMNFDIVIGKYRLTALEKAAIKCSVENLADTADITLPGPEKYNGEGAVDIGSSRSRKL